MPYILHTPHDRSFCQISFDIQLWHSLCPFVCLTFWILIPYSYNPAYSDTSNPLNVYGRSINRLFQLHLSYKMYWICQSIFYLTVHGIHRMYSSWCHLIFILDFTRSSLNVKSNNRIDNWLYTDSTDCTSILYTDSTDCIGPFYLLIIYGILRMYKSFN